MTLLKFHHQLHSSIGYCCCMVSLACNKREVNEVKNEVELTVMKKGKNKREGKNGRRTDMYQKPWLHIELMQRPEYSAVKGIERRVNFTQI